MKKALISPLCSALVIPGLGQIINQNLKKGVSILLSVFLLFIAITFKLWQIISLALRVEGMTPFDFTSVMENSLMENTSLLWQK